MVLRAVASRHGLGESGSRYLLANLQEDMLMTKADLVEKIAAKANLTKAAAERALNAFLASVEDSLSKEAKLTLTGFGTFAVESRKARQGRNPRTGATLTIPACKWSSSGSRQDAQRRIELIFPQTDTGKPMRACRVFLSTEKCAFSGFYTPGLKYYTFQTPAPPARCVRGSRWRVLEPYACRRAAETRFHSRQGVSTISTLNRLWYSDCKTFGA